MPFIPLIAIALVLLLDALPWYTSKKRRRKETASRVWTRVLIFVALIAIVWWGLFMPRVNKDWVTDIQTVNPEGQAGKALIAYYPGRSDFQQDIGKAFAEGMAANGWRVDMTAAGSGAPTNVSDYDLVVLGSPTYFFQPAGRITKYVKTLNLAGKDVVVITSGLFSTTGSANALQQAARTAGGNAIKAVEVKTGSGMAGMTNPTDVAREAGAAIPLP